MSIFMATVPASPHDIQSWYGLNLKRSPQTHTVNALLKGWKLAGEAWNPQKVTLQKVMPG